MQIPKTTFFFAIIFLLCVFFTKADMARAFGIQFFPNISHDASGTVTGSGDTPSLTWNSRRHCLGTFPTCTTYVAGTATSSSTILNYMNAAFHLEKGYANYAATTPDGTYWVGFYSGQNYTGDAYYFVAMRSSAIWQGQPASPAFTVSSPASGATVTSNSTNITGSYYSLNAGSYGYGYLHIWFQNSNSQVHSQTYSVAITSASGSFSTPLSAFGITENGTWNLYAQQELDANTYQSLTPSPAYTLNFNVAGNSIPYTFTDWNTWYPENAAGGYIVPSDFAESIEGFFEPIFTNAYEFANQTLRYFNADTSYAKGNQIGLMFPTTQAYINKINIFFGGFPLIQFFEFAIVVMLGVFIVRTIFKFIPFFG